MATWSSWVITSNERANHDKQFALLNPVDGFLGTDRLKAFFLKSGLPPFVLGQIWALSDITADGKMDNHEFSIAMYLINKRLEGMALPTTLPPSLVGNPNPSVTCSQHLPTVTSIPTTHTHTTTVPATNNTESAFGRLAVADGLSLSSQRSEMDIHSANPTQSHTPQRQQQSSWVMTANTRAKYEELFRKHARHNHNHITGLEAKAIFTSSGIPQHILAHIWSLSDLDKDGNLNQNEFCIASFLIGKALTGVRLPAALPASLLQSEIPGRASPVEQSDVQEDTAIQPKGTFEDKRRENFLQGEAELERRRQQLEDQMRLEKEVRLEKEREELRQAEQTRLEKQRLEAEEAERQAKRLADLHARREASRCLAEESRQKARLDMERQRQLDAERIRVDRLLVERGQAEARRQQALAHQASLMESASYQQLRNSDLETRISNAQVSIDQTKAAIAEKRGKRDSYERELRDLTEQVEAAKADLTRWQRERQQLTLKVAMGGDAGSAAEQCKTLQANCELRSKNIQKLRDQLDSLDIRLTQQGEELATWRNKELESTQRSTSLHSELVKLRGSVVELRNQAAKELAFTPSVSGIVEESQAPVETTPYEVMFDFVARHPDELSLKTGSVVHVHNNPTVNVVSGWLFGELSAGSDKLGGAKGLFPETYVRKKVVGKIDPFDPFGVHKGKLGRSEPVAGGAFQPPSTTTTVPNSLAPEADEKTSSASPPFYCRALYPFESSVAGDLHLVVDDIVRVTIVQGEWWEGTCERTKLSGIFPANYCQRLGDREAESLLNRVPETVSDSSPPIPAVAPAVTATKPEVNTSASPLTLNMPSEAPAVSQSLPSALSLPGSAGTSGAETAPSSATAGTGTVGDTGAKPELARAIAPFTGTSAGQLSLQPGQIVLVRKRSPKGWWEGELQQRGRVRQFGWFPAEYVRLVSPSSAAPGTVVSSPPSCTASSSPTSSTSAVRRPSSAQSSTNAVNGAAVSGVTSRHSRGSSSQAISKPSAATAKSTKSGVAWKKPGVANSSSHTSPVKAVPGVEMMQAIFAYKAAHADELSFEEGDVIVLLGRDEPEWWRGRLQTASGGAEGLFPVNYVKPYHGQPSVDSKISHVAASSSSSSSSPANARTNVTSSTNPAVPVSSAAAGKS